MMVAMDLFYAANKQRLKAESENQQLLGDQVLLPQERYDDSQLNGGKRLNIA